MGVVRVERQDAPPDFSEHLALPVRANNIDLDLFISIVVLDWVGNGARFSSLVACTSRNEYRATRNERTMEHKYTGHAKIYIKVWMALLALTAITVAVSYHDFGDWNIFVAMLVATIKGALVCLFFMHLKYDNQLNRVVFVSAFVFLGIFIGLTGSDEWFRPVDKPVAVHESASQTLSTADINNLRVATPELVAKGKQYFAVQCAVCHGANGKGDGPGAAALNPKPRDFTSGYWRYGGEPTHVFNTISNGSPGTAMAGFGSLSVADRWALVAFVRSLSPNAPADTPEDLKREGLDKTSNEQRATSNQKPSETIPVAFAIKQMAEPDIAITDQTTDQKTFQNVGEKIYQAECMSCHGTHGKGGIPLAVVSVNPPVYLKAKDFSQSTGDWVNNRSRFIKLVSQGLPGRNMPGFAGFNDGEWSALYQYILALTRK